MKYKTIIETDDYKDFEFFEDGNGKYMIGKDAGATASGGWMPLYFTECEQEPKIGHWITKDGKEQGYDIGGVKTWYIQIMCSECGFIKTAIEGHTGQYHYCPNCGAKMGESKESEEK